MKKKPKIKKIIQNNKKDFLLEIGTEELPPLEINKLASFLTNSLENNLKELGLTFDKTETFSTPRRLAVLIYNLDSKQPPQTIKRKGPPIEIAFDKNKKPTIAATKFAKSCGVDITKLKKINEKDKTFLAYQATKPGKKTNILLPEIIINSIKKLPIKKPMCWGKNHGPFVRPVHWVVAIFDNKPIKLELFGIKASNKTFGHRFLYPRSITITKPQQYEKLLLTKGKVIADANKRQQKIHEQIKKTAKKDLPIISQKLLFEVTNLVEWPVALLGSFDKRLLKIPREVLITTIQTHQRHFPLVDKKNKLLPRFVIISNIKSKSPQKVIAGNEKVVQARLSDAEYFYNSDLKIDFAKNLEQLKSITFQKGLGSLYDKAIRLKNLASFIATEIGENPFYAERAALLAKCDLVTSMVEEFPELEGIMGHYYASTNESEDIATAIKEQYLPRFAQDNVPQTPLGAILALSDRIDTLVGFFGINKIPSGDKDPFGLRRAASGILHIIIEKDLQLNLQKIFTKSLTTYQGKFSDKNLVNKLVDFIYDRLRHLYLEQNKNINIFRAILACRPTTIQDFNLRFTAVDQFTKLSEADDLIAIYKRIKNILTKIEKPLTTKFNLNLAKQPEEKNLAKIIEQQTKIIFDLYQNKKYSKVLKELVKLKKPLDDFFTKVMVMVDDNAVRNNRLALLASLQQLFSLAADLSCLVSGGK